MVGVVVVGTMSQHQIRSEFANQPDDPVAGLQGRQQPPVSKELEDVVLHADHTPRPGSLFGPASHERRAVHLLMPLQLAVGHADEPDLMPQRPIKRDCATGQRSQSSGWAPMMRIRRGVDMTNR